MPFTNISQALPMPSVMPSANATRVTLMLLVSKKAENAQRYTVPEERRASHILVKADKNASAADREKAKAKAEALLAEVRKNPSSFAEVAKKNSDDPGSAEKGGDLEIADPAELWEPGDESGVESRQVRNPEAAVAVEEQRIVGVELEALAIGEQHRDVRPVLRGIEDLLFLERSRVEGDVRRAPARAAPPLEIVAIDRAGLPNEAFALVAPAPPCWSR